MVPRAGLPPVTAPSAAPPAAPIAPPLNARCCRGVRLAHPAMAISDPTRLTGNPRILSAIRCNGIGPAFASRQISPSAVQRVSSCVSPGRIRPHDRPDLSGGEPQSIDDLAIRTKALTCSMSFKGPPSRSVCVFESTPAGPTVRIASATFVGPRPPARMTGVRTEPTMRRLIEFHLI